MAFKGVPANSPRWGSETGGPSPGGPALCSFPARIRLSPSPRSRSSPEGLALRAGATQEDLLGADGGGGGVEALRAQASCGCRMCETVPGPQAGDSCKAPQRAGVSRGQRLLMGEAAQGSAWASLQEVPTGAERWGVGEAQRWGGLPILQRLIHGQMPGSGKVGLDGLWRGGGAVRVDVETGKSQLLAGCGGPWAGGSGPEP